MTKTALRAFCPVVTRSVGKARVQMMRRENGIAYPPPRSETERGRGHKRPLAAVLKQRRCEASAWVGGFSLCVRPYDATTPTPARIASAMFADPPRRKRGEGKKEWAAKTKFAFTSPRWGEVASEASG
jgi:hypothetical protein